MIHIIIARRWQSYYTVKILTWSGRAWTMNKARWFWYGTGDTYLGTAFDMLCEMGVLVDNGERLSSGMRKAEHDFRMSLRSDQTPIITIASDVATEAEMMA